MEEIIEEERVPAVRPSVGVALWLNKFIVNTRNLRLVLLKDNNLTFDLIRSLQYVSHVCI